MLDDVSVAVVDHVVVEPVCVEVVDVELTVDDCVAVVVEPVCVVVDCVAVSVTVAVAVMVVGRGAPAITRLAVRSNWGIPDFIEHEFAF